MFEKNIVIEELSCSQFDIQVENYIRHYTDVWHLSDSDMPELGIVYSSNEKLRRERNLEKFLNAIKKEAKKNGYSASDQLRNHEKYSPAIKSFLKDGLGFKETEIEILFSHEFLKTTSKFIEAARDFDSNITSQDIFQALRNVWTMNWLQFLFVLPVELTPSIFAYSMLYPYTDNYLDNPAISQTDKINFNKRLSERLNGSLIEAVNHHEQVIYHLVGMIESQYDRSIYPGVFESLLAIHSAQIKSIKLLDPISELTDEDLLNISLEKGGTSVLADGYLVAGNLTEEQRTFLFGYGAYLQLIDDLQDIREDSKNNFKTIFSNAANQFPLDKLINQTHHFGENVLLNGISSVLTDKFDAFEIMRKSNKLMLIGALAITPDFYSSSFVKGIESHSPFHFSFLRKHQQNFQSFGV